MLHRFVESFRDSVSAGALHRDRPALGLAARRARLLSRPGRNEFLTYTPPTPDLPYLFSFMGSTKTAPVRREIARLSHPRGFFRDTAADYERALHRRMIASEWRDYYRRYAEQIRASKFVLCPRGLSVSSIRLIRDDGNGTRAGNYFR